MSQLVTVVGNPRPGSRTRAAAEAVAARVREQLGFDGTDTLDLAELVAVGFGPEAVVPSAPRADAVEAVAGARLLLVATPSYKGTYTGLLKVFLDQLPHQGLAGVTAVPFAVAASPAHVEATGATLRDVLLELGADVPVVTGALDSTLADEAELDRAAAAVATAARPFVISA